MPESADKFQKMLNFWKYFGR